MGVAFLNLGNDLNWRFMLGYRGPPYHRLLSSLSVPRVTEMAHKEKPC